MSKNKKILITYASRTGNTEKLAESIAKATNEVEGVTADIKKAHDVKTGVAISADGYAFGSDSAFEYMEGEVKTLLEELYYVKERIRGKPVLLFTTGNGGQVSALESMDRLVNIFNPRWIKPGIAVECNPGESDMERVLEMGKKLAEAVKK